MSIFDFSVQDAQGLTVDLSIYKGKVLLIVNTATKCGFTSQYKELQDLYEKYSSQGFEILDFPCNQFANQAPGTNEEIVTFCQTKYNTTFKQFAKIQVNGKDEHPLYSYLKEQKKGIMGKRIKWNFTKFLVDCDGNVVKRYAPTVAPHKIDEDIKNLLDKNSL